MKLTMMIAAAVIWMCLSESGEAQTYVYSPVFAPAPVLAPGPAFVARPSVIWPYRTAYRPAPVLTYAPVVVTQPPVVHVPAPPVVVRRPSLGYQYTRHGVHGRWSLFRWPAGAAW